MTPFLKPLPRYRNTIEIGALQVKAIIPNPRGVELHFVDETFVPMQVSLSWVAASGLKEGDYLGVFEDGHMSRIPADAFECGDYTPVDAPASPPSRLAEDFRELQKKVGWPLPPTAGDAP